jgi:flagellar hook-length control protein FliK
MPQGIANADGLLQQLQALLANAKTGNAPVTAQLAASDILGNASAEKSDLDIAALLASLSGQANAANANQFPALLQAQLAAQGQNNAPVTPAALANANGAAVGKPELTAEQLAQLKALGADAINATSADPSFARLIAGAIAAHGQPNTQHANGAAPKSQPAAGLDANANPANATNGANAQVQASPLDSKSAVAGNNGAGSQQNAQQQANQSLDFTKSMNAALAAQPGYFPAQPGFSAELMQVQNPQVAAGLAQQVPLDALAVQIARKFEEGASRFEISLHPAELGKLDISLNVSQDGRVHAVLRAERADTLDLLRQDSRTLETQLRQAGLDVGSNSLSFQLSQGSNQRPQADAQSFTRSYSQDDAGPQADIIKTSYVAVRKSDGLDIHV